MAFVSDAKTATEMRDEIVKHLQREVTLALSTYRANCGPGGTAKEREYSRGRVAALLDQGYFWRAVWVEDAQHPFCTEGEKS